MKKIIFTIAFVSAHYSALTAVQREVPKMVVGVGRRVIPRVKSAQRVTRPLKYSVQAQYTPIVPSAPHAKIPTMTKVPKVAKQQTVPPKAVGMGVGVVATGIGGVATRAQTMQRYADLMDAIEQDPWEIGHIDDVKLFGLIEYDTERFLELIGKLRLEGVSSEVQKLLFNKDPEAFLEIVQKSHLADVDPEVQKFLLDNDHEFFLQMVKDSGLHHLTTEMQKRVFQYDPQAAIEILKTKDRLSAMDPEIQKLFFEKDPEGFLETMKEKSNGPYDFHVAAEIQKDLFRRDPKAFFEMIKKGYVGRVDTELQKTLLNKYFGALLDILKLRGFEFIDSDVQRLLFERDPKTFLDIAKTKRFMHVDPKLMQVIIEQADREGTPLALNPYLFHHSTLERQQRLIKEYPGWFIKSIVKYQNAESWFGKLIGLLLGESTSSKEKDVLDELCSLVAGETQATPHTREYFAQVLRKLYENPDVGQQFLSALQNEQRLIHEAERVGKKRPGIFYHGQEAAYGLQQDVVRGVLELVDPSLSPEDFLHIQIPKPLIYQEKPSAGAVWRKFKRKAEARQEQRAMMAGRLEDEAIRYSNRLAANASIFGNLRDTFSCTWDYVSQNVNCRQSGLDWDQTLTNLGISQENQLEFAKRLRILENEHRKLQKRGRLLQIVVPAKKIDTYVYPATKGSIHQAAKLKTGEEIKTTSEYLRILRERPQDLEDIDISSEVAIPLTEAGVLDPKSGVKVIAFDAPISSSEQKKLDAFKRKRDKVIRDIADASSGITHVTPEPLKKVVEAFGGNPL